MTLRADRLTTHGGMSCRMGRTIVRRFLREQLRDLQGCAAVAAEQGGICPVGAYACNKATRRASCTHERLQRGVRFRERDRTSR